MSPRRPAPDKIQDPAVVGGMKGGPDSSSVPPHSPPGGARPQPIPFSRQKVIYPHGRPPEGEATSPPPSPPAAITSDKDEE